MRRKDQTRLLLSDLGPSATSEKPGHPPPPAPPESWAPDAVSERSYNLDFSRSPRALVPAALPGSQTSWDTCGQSPETSTPACLPLRLDLALKVARCLRFHIRGEQGGLMGGGEGATGTRGSPQPAIQPSRPMEGAKGSLVRSRGLVKVEEDEDPRPLCLPGFRSQPEQRRPMAPSVMTEMPHAAPQQHPPQVAGSCN